MTASHSSLASLIDAPLCPFSDLPDTLVEKVGYDTLANNVRDLLRLCQTCQTLREKLEDVRRLAETRRLYCLPELTAKQIVISNDGRTLTPASCTDDVPWVSGRLLPTVGRTAWKVRVDNSQCNDGNGMWIGVCDAEARCSWGLELYSGRLRCICRNPDGKLDYGPPPEGYPNGNYTTIVMRNNAGRHTDMKGRATGAVVEVVLDHDTGTLGYHINGGRYLKAFPISNKSRRPLVKKRQPTVFPQGAALRPYVSCYYPGDRLTFITSYV